MLLLHERGSPARSRGDARRPTGGRGGAGAAARRPLRRAVEQEIERRAQELAAQRRPSHPPPTIPLALGSLGIAIPLLGIAGGTAGLPGVIAVCIAIVLVNLFWATQR